MNPKASRPSSVARRMSCSEWPRSRSRATIRAWLTAPGDQAPLYWGTSPSRAQRRSVATDTPALSAASWSGIPGPPLAGLLESLFAITVIVSPAHAGHPVRAGPGRTRSTERVGLGQKHAQPPMLRRRDPDENEIPPPAGVTARCVGRWRSSRCRRRLAAASWDVLRAPATLRPGALVVALGLPLRAAPVNG